ncbi:hypothetical protein KC368_g19 [Hortaea werneckii]|nr:hypothetical protein KC368_g19 [Hortaea werneckii]
MAAPDFRSFDAMWRSFSAISRSFFALVGLLSAIRRSFSAFRRSLSALRGAVLCYAALVFWSGRLLLCYTALVVCSRALVLCLQRILISVPGQSLSISAIFGMYAQRKSMAAPESPVPSWNGNDIRLLGLHVRVERLRPTAFPRITSYGDTRGVHFVGWAVVSVVGTLKSPSVLLECADANLAPMYSGKTAQGQQSSNADEGPLDARGNERKCTSNLALDFSSVLSDDFVLLCGRWNSACPVLGLLDKVPNSVVLVERINYELYERSTGRTSEIASSLPQDTGPERNPFFRGCRGWWIFHGAKDAVWN